MATTVFRTTWASRRAFACASALAIAGLGWWRLPFILHEHGGWGVILWTIAALLALTGPLLLEYAVGDVLQRAWPEALRQVARPLRLAGWLGVMAAGLAALLLAGGLAWSLVVAVDLILKLGSPGPDLPIDHARVALAVATGHPGPFRFQGGALVGLLVTALALFLLVRGGLGAIGRYAMIALPLAGLLVLALGGMVLVQGWPRLEAGLGPVQDPWGLTADLGLAVLPGLGAGLACHGALARRLERGRDLTGLAMVAMPAGALAALGLALLTATALTSASPGFISGPGIAPSPLLLTAGTPLAFTAAFAPGLAACASLAWLAAAGLLAFGALAVVVEGIVAALEERWPVGRERLGGWVCCLGVFAALPLTSNRVGSMCGLGWELASWTAVASLALVTGGLALSGGIEPLRRHLDAHSALRLGRWWTPLLGIAVPAAVLLAAAARLLADPAPVPAPVPGWWPAVASLAVLAAAALIAGARLAHGPDPVDPNAVTLENYDPVDFDTDGETRARITRTGTDPGTRPGI